MKTIPQTLRDTARAYPDMLAIQEELWSLSYQQLLDRVLHAAAVLQSAGLGKGERFAIWAPNCAEWVITALAGQTLGAVLVPLNTRYKGAEAADIIRRAGVKILLTVEGFLDLDYPAMLAGEDLPELKETIILRDASNTTARFDAFMAGAAAPLDVTVIDEVHPDDLSDIIYTSGTTGDPKGAMTAHGQNVAVFETFTNAIGMRKGDRYLIVNPFFHSFGYKAGWLSCIIKGVTIYPLAVFDPADVLKRIARDKITVMPGAPTIFQSLLAHSELATTDISSLRVATTGATTIPVNLIRDMHETLKIDNVYSAYGLTESCGVVSLCQAGDDFETIATTCGRAMENTELRLVDDDGQDVESGEEGELWVRGFNVMLGYLDDPAATAETITPEGWLKTGDIATRDDAGYIRITDRKKDMIIVGGFNCYPAEVEKCLTLHPDIVDAAVKAMPDERLGEVPRAFVITGKTDMEAQEVIDWCKEKLANFKVPRMVDFVADLPRNASGKVQKFLLPD